MSRWKCSFFKILFTLALLPLVAVAEVVQIPQLPAVCDSILLPQTGALALINAFLKFKQTSFKGGFELTRQGQEQIHTVVFPQATRTPWISKIWSYQGAQFRFLDIGYKRFEADSRLINKVVKDHLVRHPDEGLQVYFGVRRAEDLTTLSIMRWYIHDKVLGVYARIKGYLTERDINLLNMYNAQSRNNDVLAVFQDSAGTTSMQELMSRIDLDLLMTIQISYYGDEMFNGRPDLKGILKAAGYEMPKSDTLLPFEYRITDPNKRDEFRRRFYSQFPAKTTCEFGRYARFGKIPAAIRDRLLAMAVLKVRTRGVKTIVAGVDEKTMQLFLPYGFKVYSELPIEQSDIKEYLIYMNVNSPEFEKFEENLRKSSESVVVKKEELR